MEIIDYFIAPYRTYSWIQILMESTAVCFGILSVYFSTLKNIWVYPTGIISTSLYVYMLFHFDLWGDMMINFYYTAMSIYGWIMWSRSTEDKVHVEVSRSRPKHWIISAALFLLSVGIVTTIYYFKPYLDNGFSMNGIILDIKNLEWVNYMDIFTTSVFLVGMWLMAEKKVENWIFWIIADIICIPMFFVKGLGLTALQYMVFTALAFFGYFEWMRSIRKSETLKTESYENAI